MNSSIIFTICRVLAASLLFVAIFNNSQTFFSILRFVVSATAIWGISIYLKKNNEKKQNGVILFFYIILLILFNPIYIVTFERYIWIPIDIICGILLFVSILIHKSDLINKTYLKTVFKKSTFTLAILTTILCFYLSATLFIDPINLIYLKYNGKQVVGKITKISPNFETSKDQDGEVYEVFVVSYELNYQFTLDNGEKFIGNTENGENPIKNITDEEFIDTYSTEYSPSETEIYLIKIFYQQSNPLNNKAIFDVDTSINMLVIKLIFLLIVNALVIFIGFRVCKKIFNNEIITNRNI